MPRGRLRADVGISAIVDAAKIVWDQFKATLSKWRSRHDTCLCADRGAMTQTDWPSRQLLLALLYLLHPCSRFKAARQ